jgi:septal ring factor EnvC (AmiA/AmiB activator)
MEVVVSNFKSKSNTVTLEDIKNFVNNINILNYYLDEDLKVEEDKLEKIEIKLNKLVKQISTENKELQKIESQLNKERLKSKIMNSIFKIVTNLTYLSKRKKDELLLLIDELDTFNMEQLEEQNKHFNKLLSMDV